MRDGDARDRLHDGRQGGVVVHVRGPVQRQQGIGAGLQAELRPGRPLDGGPHVLEERVHHAVADEVHPLGSDALPSEVRVRALLGREEVGREMVGDDAIDLLGHRPVEGAQSRFDVAEGNPLLGGDERDRRRGVHVASDEDDVGPVLAADLLERRHDPGGLAGVRVGADFEVDVGPRHAELIEEDARHVFVVVLTGVHEEVRDPPLEDLLHDGRHLHEVRPSADDAQDLHATAPSR